MSSRTSIRSTFKPGRYCEIPSSTFLKLNFTTKLNIWTMGFIISPFLSPFAFGFLVARTSWRWAYGIGSMYSLIVVLLIVFFMEETYVSTISL